MTRSLRIFVCIGAAFLAAGAASASGQSLAPIWPATPSPQAPSKGPDLVGAMDRAVSAGAQLPVTPVFADQSPDSVYAPPAPPRQDTGQNQGGVHFDIDVLYSSDYVYRGLLHGPLGPDDVGNRGQLNEQFDGKLEFDFGKFPHPFVGLFLNIDNSDEVSRFQELRPFFGVDWEIKPLLITAGNNSYIYPDRENEFNTDEVFIRVQLDDSRIWKTEKPILSPYIYGAYDYDMYHGFYFELGFRHDFVIEETGLTVSPVADVAYVAGDHEFQQTPTSPDSGFQHFDVGTILNYSLNHLLNLSNRFGEFGLVGYVYYTNSIDSDLKGDSILWGGGGVSFRY